MAWTLTIMGRPFLRAGGFGDLRGFQRALGASLLLAGCAVVLLLTTPFLANYAVMNLALFLVLFAGGFLTARIRGQHLLDAKRLSNPQRVCGTQSPRAGRLADHPRHVCWPRVRHLDRDGGRQAALAGLAPACPA
jgi:hypothetical protein